LGLYKERLTID